MNKAKKRLAAVFAADEKFAFALGAALLSFKTNSPLLFKEADFFVFTNNMSAQNKEALQKIAPVDFLPFKLPFEARQIQTLGLYSELTFARYECFSLLRDYRHVLWLDSDILVLKEFKKLFGDAKNPVSMSKDYNALIFNFFTPAAGYDMAAENYNSGLLLLKDTLPNAQEIKTWLYQQTKNLAPALKCPDQAVLNLAAQHFKWQISDVPRVYNAQPFSYPVKISEAKILHAMGPNKFWNNYRLAQWNGFYLQWLALGGKPFEKQKTALLPALAFKARLWIEKIPVLWTLFNYINKRRFDGNNRRLLKWN
ncbi:MAG: hypothetical protein LBR90_00945 [Elusimicrobiota bacterium]|jgi:lipopolysaccharide biosynthesis glycosyltransferase|nr:hypothetical protein [Elusimicrobiota bacterium]